jgi:hypothetical protein
MKMDKVRLLLTVISILIVVVPILGIVLAYQNNLLGLIIPPEVNEITDNLMHGGSSNGNGQEVPSQITTTYDPASRTFTLTFQYKNPFFFDVTINSMSGNIVCDTDNFPLGTANLADPVSLDAGETATLTVHGTWTEAAVSHFQTAHPGAKTINADLVDLVVDAQGIKIQTNQRIQLPNIPIT